MDKTTKTKTQTSSRKDADWCELYEYVKTNILGYDTQKLPSHFILRLKGLAKGKFIANKNIKPMANYDFKTILYTFKICKPAIMEALRSVAFKDESHKINYIMVIIEKEINNVVERINKKKISEEKVEVIDITHQDNESAEYKRKEKKENKHLEDLW